MGHIRYEVSDRVATVTIDRPEKRNAMTWAILAEFAEAIRRAGSDDDVGAVMVTGAGGAFCAGTDLTDLAGTPEDERSRRGREGSPGRPAGAAGRPAPAAISPPSRGPRGTSGPGGAARGSRGGRRGRSSPAPSRWW